MKRIIRLSIVGFLVLATVAYVSVSFIIASGVTKAERKPQTDTPASYGIQFKDVEFLSRKGDVTLKGWHIAAQEGKPTVIFVHGISSNRSGDEAVDLASRLARMGFGSILFDLRAHGDSGGERISGGYFEREDMLGAFDFLVRNGVSHYSIGVIGKSMGAGTAILGAAEEPKIHAVVADSTYANVSELVAYETARKTSVPEWIAPIFVPGAKLEARAIYRIDIGALVPEKAVEQIAYPILVIHGSADERIPLSHGQRVYQAAKPGSALWLVPNVGHVEAFKTYPNDYTERISTYFLSRLSVQ